jgi:hypothetical protein
MAGCGLGAVVLEDKPGIVQVVAATLNGIIGNQTSGITTGTLNCDGESGASASIDQQVFVDINYASLMRDAATGQGEYVSTLGTLLGCEAAVLPRFSEVAQAKHGELFVSGTPDETLVNIKKAVAGDEILAASCSRI